MSEALRIIKRYPNRRLYDTITSRYITLGEIRELVLKQIKFKIIDNHTNEDLTSYVLLQIISEEENGNIPIFTIELLENIIRFYGNPLQKNMSQFLEKCFSLFSNAHSEKHPIDLMTRLTKQNMDMWQSTFSQYFNSKSKNSTKTRKKQRKPPPNKPMGT